MLPDEAANSMKEIDSSRIQVLNDGDIRDGSYVLYWMQQSQRVQFNHALAYAVELADHYQKSVLAAFVVDPDYPEANHRHFRFMLEGIMEVRQQLKDLGIQLVLRVGSPPEVIGNMAPACAMVVCDRGYLRHQIKWRAALAENSPCRVVQVESDAVVPVETASTKAEYAARTLRPKITRQLDRYLKPIRIFPPKRSSLDLDVKSISIGGLDDFIDSLKIDMSVSPVTRFYKGGPSRAEQVFTSFLKHNLNYYPDDHNQPQKDSMSHMSMYLHFGQVSSLDLALRVKDAGAVSESAREAYLEQLIVRRELAVNLVFHKSDYDRYASIPGWAGETLDQHRGDRREHLYRAEELENGQTHDPYWNAAMGEMAVTGYMHNYMRMYWGKKILEWSESPEAAYQSMLYLNNKYFVDGRDPNSYAGVGWIFGLHDRAWKERGVYGKIRYMAASGLERKCDIGAYVDRIGRLAGK